MKGLFDTLSGKALAVPLNIDKNKEAEAAGNSTFSDSKKACKKWNCYKGKNRGALLYVAIAVLGVLLMQFAKIAGGGSVSESVSPIVGVASGTEKTAEEPANITDGDYAALLEKKLEDTLSQAAGVGKIKVALTLSENGETHLATDTTYEVTRAESGAESGTVSEKNETRHVFANTGNGGTSPVVIKTGAPKIEGAVIVAEGAESPYVKAALTKACAAVLNLEPHKIEVLGMK